MKGGNHHNGPNAEAAALLSVDPPLEDVANGLFAGRLLEGETRFPDASAHEFAQQFCVVRPNGLATHHFLP